MPRGAELTDVLDPAGTKAMLLGNEAIARGAIEAGCDVATTYPGTPSSEIGATFSKAAKGAGMYFEYSTNEKVALEVAAGAAIAGLRAFAFMKHVGVNVAADSLMTLITTGTKGGFVILSADDPSMQSRQNAQDNRYYALLGNFPMLEPATPAEAKEMTRYAFELSEETELPVFLRTTTRVNHARGPVEFGPVGEHRTSDFVSEPFRFVTVPMVARKRHPVQLEQMAVAEEISEHSDLNFAVGDADLGIITSGVSYTYVMDAIDRMGIEARVLKLGITHPVPRKMILRFLKGAKQVVVVEELEPYLETMVRAIAQEGGVDIPIYGKSEEHFPRAFEYNVDVVERGISSALGLHYETNSVPDLHISAPSRPPNLCPGCPHRASFYAAKLASRGKGVYTMDIGCYTLGLLPPLQMADIGVSMGSSIGTACGLSKVQDKPVIAFIGDSTFFHAGVPPLINALHNKHKFVLAILDNRTTAMTGHQPHPGSTVDGMGDSAPAIDIEKLVRGLGIDFVELIDPYDLKATTDVFKRALEHEGIAVVVCRQTCALLLDAAARRTERGIVPYTIDQDKCTKCHVCVERFGCAAMILEDGVVEIDEQLCDGCGVCAQVCKFGAIEVME